MRLRSVAIGIACWLTCAVPIPASAQVAVDLKLVLAVDASGSVDTYRFELQKQGYVAAFRNPRLLKAIASGASRAIAVTMVQWTGPTQQNQVVPWSLIGDAETAAGFADKIDAANRTLSYGGTSISGAIDYGVRLLGDDSYQAERQVIDVSGDGANNRGRPAFLARDEAVSAGITINGLPILAVERDLERHYRNNVIGGPGAFVIAVERYEDFAEAILRKLILEIALR